MKIGIIGAMASEITPFLQKLTIVHNQKYADYDIIFWINVCCCAYNCNDFNFCIPGINCR